MTYYIAYDCERRKVGCVLLQVAFGGTVPTALFYDYFSNSDSWLLAPTPDLKCYPITEEQLAILAAKTDFTREERHG